MTLRKTLLLVAVTCVLGFLAVRAALAFDQPKWSLPSLRGLTGVGVTVEDLTREVERLGLTKDQIRTDVELRLRKAGITVLEDKTWSQTPGFPYLYINATGLLPTERTGIVAFAVNVALLQEVTLTRDASIRVDAHTWDSGHVAMVGEHNLREIRNGICDEVDKFINDYLAMNPRAPAESNKKP